jgi:hypothetical protein
MKHILNKFINGLMTWAEMIHEYRQSSASKYHYWR